MQLLWVKSYCTCTWLSGQLENSPSFHGDAVQVRWNKMGQGGGAIAPSLKEKLPPSATEVVKFIGRNQNYIAFQF